MSKADLTVREALSAPDLGAQTAPPDRWGNFQKQVEEEVKSIKWPMTMPDVAAMVGELFDIPIPGLLLGSWRKADALLKLLRESEESPEEVMYLELADHMIERKLYPYIQIKIENFEARRLDFTLHLSLRLKGFILKVQEGQVKEILTGQCEFGGMIDFMKRTVLKKEFSPIKLPGSIPLTENGEPESPRKHPEEAHKRPR